MSVSAVPATVSSIGGFWLPSANDFVGEHFLSLICVHIQSTLFAVSFKVIKKKRSFPIYIVYVCSLL